MKNKVLQQQIRDTSVDPKIVRQAWEAEIDLLEAMIETYKQHAKKDKQSIKDYKQAIRQMKKSLEGKG